MCVVIIDVLVKIELPSEKNVTKYTTLSAPVQRCPRAFFKEVKSKRLHRNMSLLVFPSLCTEGIVFIEERVDTLTLLPALLGHDALLHPSPGGRRQWIYFHLPKTL